MSQALFGSLRRLSVCTRCIRRFSSSRLKAQSFRENDSVILRKISDPNATPIFVGKLKANGVIQSHHGQIRHEDIIGRSVRDQLETHSGRLVKEAWHQLTGSGKSYIVQSATLAEYVMHKSRHVTPIYPADANVIVSLLDLHFDRRSPSEAPFEMLEAGTGQGSLTLHLARALHGANDPPPSVPDETLEAENEESEQATDYDRWRSTRRAVLHTVEVSSEYSKKARRLVRGFRHGLYYPHVDFHVGDVSSWVEHQLQSRQSHTPFLHHAILDLPSSDDHFATVARALHVDGALIAFNPSITQVQAGVARVREERLPLVLDRVLELGTGGTSGAREWDVRAVQPRAYLRAQALARPNVQGVSRGEEESGVSEQGDVSLGSLGDAGDEADLGPLRNLSEGSNASSTPTATTDPAASSDTASAAATATATTQSDRRPETWQMVCRPKVGVRLVGGGFLGVWRKMRDRR